MPLMGSLYIGASGLQTSQNALNTTAHNMSNIDTSNYTRQQIQLGTSVYNTISRNASAVSYQQIGLGVVYSETKQVRDYFLDKTYRRESGRSAFYEASSEAVSEVETLLQEMDGEVFGETLTNLWTAIQDLAESPANTVNQGVFVERCYEFINKAGAVYQGLSDYQDNLNVSILSDINKINELGQKIYDLNDQIIKIEAGGIEHANDLRDQRNAALDQLSALASISYSEDTEGNTLVKIEGNDFVKAGGVNRIAVSTDTNTGFYTPYWEQLATTNPDGTINIDRAKVFDLTQTISTDINTDIGGLKSKLLCRGDKRATYQDLQDETTYNAEISQSVIMNIQAEFDQLVHKVTTTINDVLKTAADAAGTYPDSAYLRDSEGNPLQIFDTIAGTGEYTTGNIIINEEIKQAPSLLGFKKADGSVDYETIESLKTKFSAEDHTLNPNVKTKTNFVNFYNNLVSQVANTGSVLKSICENQQATVDATDAAREQIVGVSSDEELSNMIMYQNAYNAASRYINVISEMLEHIISTLAV